MVYQGQTLSLNKDDNDIVVLSFDRKNASINKLDKTTILELHEALIALTEAENISGLLIISRKNDFIVGADILEFPALMQLDAEDILSEVLETNSILSAVESLPYPTLSAINGFALGGGLEMSLTTDLRVVEQNARLGLPEVSLGLIPGYGGTVRFPRVTNAKIALEAVATGRQLSALQALDYGLVQKVCEKTELFECAYQVLLKAIAGKIDWKSIRRSKQSPLAEDKRIRVEDYQALIQQHQHKHSHHYPAVKNVLELIYNAMDLSAQDALLQESIKFSEIAKTQAATGLVQMFINQSKLKKSLNQPSDLAPIQKAAVIGAGIMGGGIAYVNARHAIDVTVCDLSERALQECQTEFERLVTKEFSKRKINEEQQQTILSHFHHSQEIGALGETEIVIEAVTEKLSVKHEVLQSLEAVVKSDCILATNTSSLCLKDLVSAVQHSDRLIGLHFFNPVPYMDLVEVIKSPSTSSLVLSKAIQYVKSIKKTPIVVNDCAGFLVNRVLTAYMLAFLKLVKQGVSIQDIDTAMVNFGWPMGPGFLQDVVGFDTLSHVLSNIAHAYPDRMDADHVSVLNHAIEQGMLGAKNQKGFYVHGAQSTKELNPHLNIELSESAVTALSHEDIVHSLMLPMLLEAVWCLEEGIVQHAYELDLAMVMGIGFPKHLGGPLKYLDWLGTQRVIELAHQYQMTHLIPTKLTQMQSLKEKFYPI